MQKNKIMIYAIGKYSLKLEPFYKNVCTIRKKKHFLFYTFEEVYGILKLKFLKYVNKI